MFISIRRKHLQLFVVLFLLVVVSVSLFQVSSVNPYSYKYNGPASPVLKPAYASANTKEEGYLDKIANKFLEGADVPESSTLAEDDDDDFEWDEQEAHKEEAYFNAKVEEMYEEKVKSDLQHKFWLLDTTMHVESTDLTIPEYYLPRKKHQPKVIKPVIQPFDPRFTLGMYYHAVKVHSIKYPDATTVLPFHWYDWVDLSILDMFLIADEAEKPGCEMVDAAPDELIIQKQEEEKKRKEEEKKKKEEEKKKKEEEEKKKKEEEEKKKEEEQKKKDEEERKHLDDANKEEERKKSEEAQKLDDAKKAENGDNKEENSKKLEDTSTDGKAKEAEVLNTSDFDKLDKKKDESKQLDAANSDKNIPEDKNENSKEVWSASHFNPEDSKQELTKDSLSGNQSDSEQLAIEAAEGVPLRVGKRDLVSRSKEFPLELDIPDLTQEEITLLMQDSDYEVRGMSVDAEEDIEEEIIYDPDYFDPEKRLVKLPDKFCLNNSQVPLDLEDGNTVYPGFNIWDVGDRLTEEKAILAGKSYLYTYAPPPSMIIFLTQDGSYNVSTSPKKSKLLDNGLAELFVQSSKSTHMNVLSEFKSLQDEVPPNKHRVISSYHVDLPEDDFIYDHKQIIATLEAKGSSRSPQEQSYLQSLYYSVHLVANGGPPKYFSEARLLGTHLGDHYDWRFFDGLLNGRYEQSLILHRLIRTWLSFTRKNGITTWVAHGSLLSWYWNGMAFPWDYDIDVQVPVQDLHKLSLEYNQTLIVEDAEDGFGRYFLDCGTFITLRERGNGNNNIDARFIDVDSGLYIDITGLAVSNTPAPSRYDHKLPKDYKPTKDDDHVGKNLALKVYNCRNMHFSSLDEISPLIKTSIEGEIGYVPKKYSEMLATEYKFGFVNKRFDGHAFLPQLRLWLKEDDLYYFYHNQTEWIKYNRFNENFLIKGGYEDYSYAYTEEEKKKLKSKKLTLTDKELEELYNMPTKDLALLLMKDEIFMEFYSSKDFTYYHEDEIMRLLFGKSTSKLIHDAPDFKPMKFDPFMFKMQSEYLTFESEIERYGLLSSKSHNKAP